MVRDLFVTQAVARLICMEAFRTNIDSECLRFPAAKSADLSIGKALISRMRRGANTEAVALKDIFKDLASK